MRVLVTGGAGFIGSHFIRTLLRVLPDVEVINLDKLTYAGNLANLEDVAHDPRYRFVRGDVADARLLNGLFREGLDAVVHLAAQTHVDRSILDGRPFVRTNVVGTSILLEAALRHGIRRFVHVSTDEVYGPAPPGVGFSEESPLNPTSPYAASKAAADLLCLAYRKTYGLPVVVTRCTNNYGPYQFPEKFIPLVITNALLDQPIPIYGDGRQERDWLYVEDHCEGLVQVLLHPDPRPVLNLASGRTATNLQVARTILRLLHKPPSLLRHVQDRPAHDRRYALDTHRARAYLNWRPRVDLEEGLERTVAWYRENRTWWEAVRSGAYRAYYETWYGKTLQAVGGK